MSVLKKVRRSLIKRGVQEDPCNNQLSHNGTTWKSISPEITKHVFYQFGLIFHFPFQTPKILVLLCMRNTYCSAARVYFRRGAVKSRQSASCRRQPILNQASSFKKNYSLPLHIRYVLFSGEVRMFVSFFPLSTKNICVIIDH